MNGYQYIIEKQSAWAKNKGLQLIGSQINRGRPMYTAKLEDNLFKPLTADVMHCFRGGDGNELGSNGNPGKMQAVHSSSALGVNVFQYWKSISAVPVIAAACGLCSQDSDVSDDIRFEDKYPISRSFKFSPNIDVVIYNRPEAKYKRFAIECKFSEAYSAQKHDGLKKKYLELSVWDDVPALRQCAEMMSPADKDFTYLHPAQLIKHILGLKIHYGVNGFRLLYLWYDVLGEQGKGHRDEIERFNEIAKKDGIKFQSLTYQDLISRLANQYRSEHKAYIQYLTERYL